MGVSSPQKHIISPNDTVIINQALTPGLGNMPTYTKKKEILVAMKGKFRVKFSLDIGTGGTTGYGKIYKNDVPFGTEQTKTTLGYETYTEDLNFDAEDLLQLYVKFVGGSGNVYWKDLKIFGDFGLGKVNLDI